MATATELSIFTKIVPGEIYKAAASRSPESIIDELKTAGLRGRGGAGFPTGLKWDFVYKSTGTEKYVVCNADEGEVGTFKDQKLLIEYAENLFEGMAIAANVIQAKDAYLYLRWEYSFMEADLKTKMAKASEIYGIRFHLNFGAGAYVCGEETALLDSIEGRRGEVRNKPPYPVEKGLFNKPTIINNVETFCCVPLILKYGAASFNAIGTEKSKGPKLFSISGDVEKPGVYEYPMGTKLTTVLEAAGARDPKAVLVGGASGICVCVENQCFERTLAFEDLPPGGAIVVFDKTRNMPHVLENLMDFFAEESCGQCTPCREGNKQLLKFVQRIKKEGKVARSDLRRYLELAETMKLASKCGLGQSAQNPFVTIIQNFMNEFVSETEN